LHTVTPIVAILYALIDLNWQLVKQEVSLGSQSYRYNAQCHKRTDRRQYDANGWSI